MQTVLSLISALLGSLGFALIFHVNRRYLVTSSLGGMLGWGVYLLVSRFGTGLFLPTFAASAFVCVWSEVFARLKKTPANQYLIVGLLPLIPGASLFYAMQSLMEQNAVQARVHGMDLAMYTLGIAAGVSATLTLLEMARRTAELIRARRRPG